MAFADLGDFRLYFEETGLGDPLVFLHGFTVDRRMWQSQVDFFIQDYRVILMDARGHGLSDAPATGYSRDHRVEDLRRFADNIGIDRFHLVGLSMGGSTAIGFALKFQERLCSLTLVSSGAAGYSIGSKIGKIDKIARREGVDTAHRQWMEWNLRWFKNDKAEVGRQMETMMKDHSGAIWKDEMRGKYPRSYDLDNVHLINVPTAIFVGERDKMFLPLAQKLHRRITGSSKTVFEGAGHMLNMEAPARFNDELKRFLDSVRQK